MTGEESQLESAAGRGRLRPPDLNRLRRRAIQESEPEQPYDINIASGAESGAVGSITADRTTEESTPGGGVAASPAKKSTAGRVLMLGGLGLLAPIVAAVIFAASHKQSNQPTPTGGASPPLPLSSPPIRVSEACDTSFLVAAAHRGEPSAVGDLDRTTEFCRTADEWVAGLQGHPGAEGLTSPADASLDALRQLCNQTSSLAPNPACRDVRSKS